VTSEPPTVLPDIGVLARARRTELGMSQEDVAYRLRVEQTQISKIERGAKTPSADFAKRLAAVLELAESTFLTRKG
jgi:transcriptional regulator with XRE-family HTH domain